MDEILPRLYLGDFEDAERVSAQAIQCILTLSEKSPTIAPGIHHIHAPIPDEVFLEPPVWAELTHAVRMVLLEPASRLLIHCRLGKSRAPSLTAAYLTQAGYTLDTALALLVSRRSIVAPHPETWRGVTTFIARHLNSEG